MARSGNQNAAAKPGLVIWITGLSGAGKTVIAQALAQLLRAENANCIVLLDGDELRWALGSGDLFQPHQRLGLAKTYGRLCRLLANQGCTVLCATVSMFEEVRLENRAENLDYFEVFIVASDSVRISRKPEIVALQSAVSADSASYQLPSSANLVIENEGDQTPLSLAKLIFDALRKQ